MSHLEREPVTAPPAATGEPLLVVDSVTKRWAPDLPPALDDVSLTMLGGYALGVSGRNGVGKTTLLRVIAGLLVPDGGHVRLRGLDADRQRIDYRRHLGFLSAGNAGLYARLDVDANLTFWARIALIPKRARGAVIDDVPDQFALHELRGRRVDRLSMGQRQRLRLAMTFLHGPELVLLDEPCTSLDEPGVALVRTALARLRAGGGSAIVCSPDSELERLELDQGFVMANGRLAQAS